MIFSNELVDAFPVRRFQKSNAGWCELAVAFDTEGKATDLMDWSAPWKAEQKIQSIADFLQGHATPADHGLTDEQGAGGAFQVLDQTCREQSGAP